MALTLAGHPLLGVPVEPLERPLDDLAAYGARQRHGRGPRLPESSGTLTVAMPEFARAEVLACRRFRIRFATRHRIAIAISASTNCPPAGFAISTLTYEHGKVAIGGRQAPLDGARKVAS